MVAEFVKNLIHLKGREDRLDQDCCLDRVRREFEFALGGDEDVVPEAGFEVALQFGQIEVWARPSIEQFLRIVKGVEREIEDTSGHGRAVDVDVRLVKVPTANSNEQDGRFFNQFVGLGGLLVDKGDRAANCGAQVNLAFDQVRPGRRRRILEIRHVDACAGVERIDHHLPIDGSGDLDSPVEQIRRKRSNGPFSVADSPGIRQKIGAFAGVQTRLPRYAGRENFLTASTEAALQTDRECNRLRGQNLGKVFRDFGAELYTFRHLIPLIVDFGFGHLWIRCNITLVKGESDSISMERATFLLRFAPEADDENGPIRRAAWRILP